MTTQPYYEKFAPLHGVNCSDSPLIFCLCCGGIVGPAVCSKSCLDDLRLVGKEHIVKALDEFEGEKGDWLFSDDDSEAMSTDEEDMDDDYRPGTQEESSEDISEEIPEDCE